PNRKCSMPRCNTRFRRMVTPIQKSCASSSNRWSKTRTTNKVLDLGRSSRASRVIIAAGTIASVCVVGLMFAALPDQVILFPTTDPINPQGAVRKAIPFENGQLELWTAKSRLAEKIGRPEVYVLRFYGNADRAERWAA